MTTRYNPWTHLDLHWPGIHVNTHAPLPRGCAGAWTPGALHLNRLLTQAGRRCTLAHEIVHLERGPAPLADPRLTAKEERAVDAIAARRLIPLHMLADALRWAPTCLDEAADECWVDRATMQARLDGLTDDERVQLAAMMGFD